VPGAAPVAYAVVPLPQQMPQILPALEMLRAAGVSVQMHAGGGSMKSQFKKADTSGARYALVFGETEVAQGMVAVKPLRDAAAPQVTRPIADASAWARELLDA
jgi:histidyl-tRNA synthetase